MPRKYQLRMLQLIIAVNIYRKERQRNLITSLEDDNSPRLAHLNEDDGWFIMKQNDSGYDVVSVDKKIFMCLKRHTTGIKKTRGYQFASYSHPT